MPGNATAQFDVPVGHMALGLGIHGEAGIAERPIADAAGLAQTLCDHVLAERPDGAEQRVAVVLNGLGATKYEELFVLWDLVREILRAEGLVPVAPLVGEYVTSLDMAGCSLSICWLTDELADCWVAPARTPAFRREAHDVAEALPPEDVRTDRGVERWPESSAEGRALGRDMADALAAVAATMADNEGHLAHLDSVAGDGDHGSAMTRGAAAAAEAAGRAVRAGAGAASVLGSAAEAWAAAAGGTSGALWERGLHAASQVVSDRDPCDAPVAATAVSAALREVELAGGARVGDKTIVDALSPFAETLNVEVRNGSKVADAWTQASLIATDAAASTADLKPRVGRARPLAERSYGHPDPGAVSFALCAEAVAGHIRTESTIS
jgi:dihydroxyacetone kinase